VSTPRKRRIMTKCNLSEISAVDAPAQEPAVVALFKRAPQAPSQPTTAIRPELSDWIDRTLSKNDPMQDNSYAPLRKALAEARSLEADSTTLPSLPPEKWEVALLDYTLSKRRDNENVGAAQGRFMVEGNVEFAALVKGLRAAQNVLQSAEQIRKHQALAPVSKALGTEHAYSAALELVSKIRKA